MRRIRNYVCGSVNDPVLNSTLVAISAGRPQAEYETM